MKWEPARALARAATTVVLIAAQWTAPGRPASAQSGPDRDLLAPPVEKPIRGASLPALSPDGKTLCFTYLGDLWTVPAGGGTASRLTVHEALDAYPRWSPDGKWIAFTSTRAGNADIWLIPAQGGDVRQVTVSSANDWVNDWSPDGTKLLFYSMRDTRAFAMHTIDLRTNAVQRLTPREDDAPLRFGSWSPDGRSIVYTRAGQPWWRAWYRGSIAAHVVLRDLNSGKVRTLLKTNTQQLWPLWSPDGKSVYITMIYGANSTPNLWRVPLQGGEPQAVTRYTRGAVRFPAIARNGSLLTFVYEGDLYTVHPDGSGLTRLSVIARSDDKVNNQERQVLTQEAVESEPSPDSKQLALVLRGRVWLLPAAGGEAKPLTDGAGADADILWSPDGARLALVSDREGQPDLYLVDVKTKALIRLTTDGNAKSNATWSPDGKFVCFARAGASPGLYIVPSTGGESRRLAEGNGNNDHGIGITSHAWSPDSRWVAFARMDRLGNRDIWVVPAVGGAAVNVTRYPGRNIDPQFTRDGRKLVFLSDRNGFGQIYRIPLEVEEETTEEDGAKKPRPDRSKDVKIDFEDIHQRAVAAAPGLGGIIDYALTPDSQKAVVQAGGRFYSIPIGGGAPQPVTQSPEFGIAIRITPDGARFFYLGANGTPRVLPVGGGPVTQVNFTAEYLFDRKVQYRMAFHQFYRTFGANFYDPAMHGVNWKALRDKYEPLLSGVGTSDEFAILLSEMVGEVNSSHSEIAPPQVRRGPQTATLGLFYDTRYSGPGLKVEGVLAKGPADRTSTRISPGEYVLSIDGTDVAANEAYYQRLQDRAGKTVEVLVNTSPQKEGARTVRLKPISFVDWFRLDYEARVREDRKRVDRLSENRLAYLHIKGMDQESLQRFERELWGEAQDKEGLILDVRRNGGGNTHDALLEALSRKVYGYSQPRDGLRQTQPTRVWNKPIVLLIDEESASDAEIFPAGFRALKLGKIVGTPTPGYVIGTYEGTLVDGTHYRLPTWAFFTDDGKNMENLGVAPDVTVINTAEDIVAGHDRQLETAVQLAMRELPSIPGTIAATPRGVTAGANDNPNGGSAAVPVTAGKERGGSAKSSSAAGRDRRSGTRNVRPAAAPSGSG